MDKPFHIFEMTRELIEDIRLRTYDSHFHDFEELIIITHGSLEHFIDFKKEIIEAPVACYVSMGKMHKLVPGHDLRGWVIDYKTAFIPDSKLSFYSNFFTSTNIPLPNGTCINRFVSLCQIINGEYGQEVIDHVTIRYLLSGLVAMVDAERKRGSPAENVVKASQVITFNNFLKILEAARLAPSACNAQPWKIIVVSDAEKRMRVADATASKLLAMNHFTKQAPLQLVILEENANFTSTVGGWATEKHYPHLDLGIILT